MYKSKVFVITKPGEFVFKDLNFPAVGPEKVLIKVKACGICTTDRRIYNGDVKLEQKLPLILLIDVDIVIIALMA